MSRTTSDDRSSTARIRPGCSTTKSRLSSSLQAISTGWSNTPISVRRTVGTGSGPATVVTGAGSASSEGDSVGRSASGAGTRLVVDADGGVPSGSVVSAGGGAVEGSSTGRVSKVTPGSATVSPDPGSSSDAQATTARTATTASAPRRGTLGPDRVRHRPASEVARGRRPISARPEAGEAFLDDAGDEASVGGEDRTTGEAAGGTGRDRPLLVQEPLVGTEGSVEPHRVVEAGHLQAAVRPMKDRAWGWSAVVEEVVMSRGVGDDAGTWCVRGSSGSSPAARNQATR